MLVAPCRPTRPPACQPPLLPTATSCATCVILSVFWGLTWRGIRLPENNKIAERLGCPVVSHRSGNGLVFGPFYDQAQRPGHCSGLGPSLYACHPQLVNGYAPGWGPGPGEQRLGLVRPAPQDVRSGSVYGQR